MIIHGCWNLALAFMKFNVCDVLGYFGKGVLKYISTSLGPSYIV